MSLSSPYLSVVVVTRNDDHGGDPLRRLQALVNTFDQQCRRSGLDAELVVVEWNPPLDKPRLATLVKPPDGCVFPLRFVEVPPSVHATLPYADVLPLFQMIGKNVGIRRARGQFVLATNIDIIFSTELVDWIAGATLEPGRLYRVDRHDIEPRYPVDAPLEEQLAYCRTHHIRIHTPTGTHQTDADGRIVANSRDIFDPPAVVPVDGWYGREGDEVYALYRPAKHEAVIRITPTPQHVREGAMLYLDVEPNPFDGRSWVELKICSEGEALAQIRASARRRVYVAVPLNGRSREVSLQLTAHSPFSRESLPPYERRENLIYRLYSARLVPRPFDPEAFTALGLAGWERAKDQPDVKVSQVEDGISVTSAAGQYSHCLTRRPLRAAADGTYAFTIECSCREGNIALNVLDVATGEWIDVRRFDSSSGGREELGVYCDLRRGQLFSLCVTNEFRGGDGVSRFVLHGVRSSTGLPSLATNVVTETFVVLRRRFRTLRKRVRGAIGRKLQGGEPKVPAIAADEWTIQGMTAEAFLKRYRPPSLAQNASGDFQLMARTHWHDLRGYPEFRTYSMSIDGLFADIAHNGGIEEQRLEDPLCIYHLEHEKGSGWTPEGEAMLRKRLAESGITWLDSTTVALWAAFMTWLNSPMIFNGPDWGFSEMALPETVVNAASTVAQPSNVR